MTLDVIDVLRRQVDATERWHPPKALSFVAWDELDGTEPPSRRFAWDNWLPTGCVTTLYAPGGYGKSLLAQEAASHIALGWQFLGEATDGRPVLCVFAEEDRDEIWRRQKRIAARLRTSLRHFARRLLVDARAGRPNILVRFGPDGLLVEGELADPLRRALTEERPGTVVLDNIAQIFHGDENNRSHVTQFVNYLTSIAREHDCAVLLVGHTAKPENSEYSGSTAWNAAVRSRLLLCRDKSGSLFLKRVKSNYAPPAEVELVWKDGLLVPADPQLGTMGERIDREKREAEVRSAVLAALETLQSRGITTSPHRRAFNWAPRVIREHGLASGFTEAELARATAQLLERGELHADVPLFRSSNRHWRYGLGRPQRKDS